MSSGYTEHNYVKVLIPVKAFEKKFTDQVLYDLGEFFSVYYHSHKLKRTSILKRKKYYRVKFETHQTQKFVVGILKDYFDIL